MLANVADKCVYHKYRFGKDPEREASGVDQLSEYCFKPTNKEEQNTLKLQKLLKPPVSP